VEQSAADAQVQAAGGVGQDEKMAFEVTPFFVYLTRREITQGKKFQAQYL